jgi:hypothetical protein
MIKLASTIKIGFLQVFLSQSIQVIKIHLKKDQVPDHLENPVKYMIVTNLTLKQLMSSLVIKVF